MRLRPSTCSPEKQTLNLRTSGKSSKPHRDASPLTETEKLFAQKLGLRFDVEPEWLVDVKAREAMLRRDAPKLDDQSLHRRATFDAENIRRAQRYRRLLKKLSIFSYGRDTDWGHLCFELVGDVDGGASIVLTFCPVVLAQNTTLQNAVFDVVKQKLRTLQGDACEEFLAIISAEYPGEENIVVEKGEAFHEALRIHVHSQAADEAACDRIATNLAAMWDALDLDRRFSQFIAHNVAVRSKLARR
ncbi:MULTISPECIES: hypothetical protein [Paraburkholderia]|uniref:hypothetical protein n=1 Tax=Paraburkholderia TaxID=1822464 RepID=UPI0003679275|nr:MULTISPECIES: hypothetical protein [Paraburkholderia]MDH6147234.1 hypothetical protein [Paraburkholderia sp. WSM4179]